MTIGLARVWWALALRGLAAVLLGVACFVWPGMRLSVLVLFYGAYALVDGICAVVAALMVRNHRACLWPLRVESFLGIGAGFVTFLWPDIGGVALMSFIAFWALGNGISKLVAASRVRVSIRGEWLLGLSGVLSVLFGILLLFSPPETVQAFVWTMGVYALLLGVMLLALAFRLRHWSRLPSMQE